MKSAMLTLFIVSLLPPCAYAQDDNSCDNVRDGVFVCPVPQKPAPPPTCHVFGDNLVCTAPVDMRTTKPSNCGWGKNGKYVCW